jgi:hypothetical protein
MKTLAFINVSGEEPHAKNWRVLDESSKFGIWTPSTVDINNVGSTKGYYQLYGPLVFYWIKITYDGTNLTAGANPRISNLPFGPESSSGLKTTSEFQVSLTARAGAGGASELLSATNDAWATATSGVSYIYLPTVWTAAVTQIIWVQGWIFRDS